jgi:dihydroorotate dehydrogenase (fumarate)
MINLETRFMGIALKNPIIVGASNLCIDTANLKKMEEAGAAAIVFKSLFEEQVQLENYEMSKVMEGYNERHAEMLRLFPGLDHDGPGEYLMMLEKAVRSVNIPVFASLNAVNPETWPDWAEKLSRTGIAGLELNFYFIPLDFNATSREIIDTQLAAIESVKQKVNIPLSVKLSPYYTNPLGNIRRMAESGANGFVLFNRFFQPDIDVETEKHITPYNLSNQDDFRLALRFAGLLHGRIHAGICASGGIYSGRDAIKLILAGADCVQVVSALYKNGIGHIAQMLAEIESWMQQKGYASLNTFKGKLSHKNTNDPFIYKRAQYVDYLLKSEQIFEAYPLR